ncbi:MAG: winged helix-turn-helix transcriptional regulator [Alphaproteobacteria bacterium]|nr:winged helix-turn-helix transcriptional regulator [Alphaproteobacteria bacterium]
MRPERKVKASGLLELEHFLPYRLSVLSNTVSHRIAKSYEQQFQLTIAEWRVMAVLGQFPGLTAAEVTDRTAMDKVQVSRAVARLKETHRIEQRAVEGDRRARHLFLTEQGHDVYSEIVPLARDYEMRVTAGLNAAERAQLERLLDKLTAAALAL